MAGKCFKINEKYSIEIWLFEKWGSFKKGLSIINFNIDFNWSRKIDHSPSFEFFLAIFNFKILEFHFFNVNHATIENGDEEIDDGDWSV